MKATFGSEFVSAAKQGPRMFFAPLVGAVKAVKSEVDRMAHASSSVNEKAVLAKNKTR